MPSFDIVSEIDHHELTNAIDQTQRELNNRFDFKGTNSTIKQEDKNIILNSQSEFQIEQIHTILKNKLTKRDIDHRCLEYQKITESNNVACQIVVLKEGIDKELAKKLCKHIKDSKLKVTTSIQEQQIRVTGKKRDDLQAIISLLKDFNLGLPLQHINFRD